MADHSIDIVDENDIVIWNELKSKKPELWFISRVVAIFVMDSAGKIIICKRSPHKKFSPNMYDLSAVWAVLQNESYLDAAKRELEEELQIKNCELKFLDKFHQEAEPIWEWKKLKYFCSLFLAITDEIPILNEELTEFKKMTIDEIEEEIILNSQNYCIWFINDFNQVKDKIKETKLDLI